VPDLFLLAHRISCECRTLVALFPGTGCKRGWAWNVGAEFWASGKNIKSQSHGCMDTTRSCAPAFRCPSTLLFSKAYPFLFVLSNVLLFFFRVHHPPTTSFRGPHRGEAGGLLAVSPGVGPCGPRRAALRAPGVLRQRGRVRYSCVVDVSPRGGSRRFSAKDAGGCVFTVNSHGLIRYCFEATWHALLGEPFYGYTPPFKVCIVLMLFIFIFDQSGIKRK